MAHFASQGGKQAPPRESIIDYFNPRAREERDARHSNARRGSPKFQSTRSRRARLSDYARCCITLVLGYIYPADQLLIRVLWRLLSGFQRANPSMVQHSFRFAQNDKSKFVSKRYLHHQKSLGIVTFLRTKMLNPALPIASQVIETDTIPLNIYYIQ